MNTSKLFRAPFTVLPSAALMVALAVPGSTAIQIGPESSPVQMDFALPGNAGIQVVVNNTPVQFAGAPPVEANGSVLVPLRGVFEAMGAGVNYDSASHTITATKGSVNVVLPLGAQTAFVNGVSHTLSQPAQVVRGTTLVPLRFVAEALGGYVNWISASQTVEIKTQDQHLASLPPPPGNNSVVGQVTGIYPDNVPPRITVRVNGVDTALPLSDNAIILRSAPGQPGIQASLGSLAIGDQVNITRDSDGAASVITATFGQVVGTVKSIGKLANGDHVITLNDGTTVELAANAPITMDNRKLALSDVMPDEKVVIRTNPNNSMGFGVAVATGSNPNPTPNVGGGGAQTALSVDSFTDDVTQTLKAGDVIHTTLVGTPNATVSFAIPGIVDNVAMTETAPGTYSGAYTIAKNLAVSGAAVIARIRIGNSSLLAQASGKVSVDSQPPKIENVSPAASGTTDTAKPLIYGTFTDGEGTGIDPGSVTIKLDGNDVTSHATVTSSFFNVTPPDVLAPGPHSASISVADKAGNVTNYNWSFTEATNKVVQSFTSNAVDGQTVSAGTDIQFTLNAAPGGHASFSIGNVAKDVAMSEKSPGQYVGVYSVQPGDNIRNAPVIATFKSADGKAVTSTLAQGLTIAAGQPQAPRIVEPTDNAVVGEVLTIKGTSAPNVTVHVTVDFVSKALGGLLSVNGSAGGTDVTADKNGNWVVSGLALKSNSLIGFDRDTTYTIAAKVISANGEESPVTTLSVRHG